MKQLLFGLCLLPGLAVAQIDLQLTRISDLEGVTEITHAGDGSGRIFLVQGGGTIWISKDGRLLDEPFLDISDRTEYGALDVAFPHDFETSGRFYVHYIDDVGDPASSTPGFTIVSRFLVSSEDTNRADGSSEEVLIRYRPRRGTNGEQLGFSQNGEVEFGSDGMLYVAFGHGEPRNSTAKEPPWPDFPQDLGSLQGKILRIDVSADTGYTIPEDNPFVDEPDALGEIWAYGVQVPRDLSVDRQTGDLYFSDYETEFNLLPAGQGGLDFGWPFFEGAACNPIVTPCRSDSGVTPPILDFTDTQGATDGSLVGWVGQLYRGLDYPALGGSFLYTDSRSGQILALFPETTEGVLLFEPDPQPFGSLGNSALGDDEVGNIYLAGSSPLRTENGVYLVSDGAPVASSRPIVGQHTGTYVVDGLPDQGFFVTVGENETGPFLFFAWFTFLDGQPYWLVGVEFFEEGDAGVVIPVSTRRGPGFLDFSGTATESEDLGEMSFTAESCDRFRVDYELNGFGNGTLILDRLTGVKGFKCD